MKVHELKKLEASGMMVEPESNQLVDLCCSWYYSVVEARANDTMNGVPMKLTWEDVKSLNEYKPSPVPIRDLAAVSFSIDEAYIRHLVEQREAARA